MLIAQLTSWLRRSCLRHPPFPLTTLHLQVCNTETRTVVRPPLTAFVLFPSSIPHSICSLLYPHQGLRRRILWYGLALRLAWAPTPQYSRVRNADSRRYPARVREYASRRRQVHEKEVGRLG